jgi:Zn ribbon nucleic-acid-binding protein
MIRWKLKGCPRCSGDLNIISDDLGYYEDCLQCGYHHYYDDEKSGFTQYETGKVKKEYEPTSVSSDPRLHENVAED